MNDTTWDIQLTLTDRSNMTYLMLLGMIARMARQGLLVTLLILHRFLLAKVQDDTYSTQN